MVGPASRSRCTESTVASRAGTAQARATALFRGGSGRVLRLVAVGMIGVLLVGLVGCGGKSPKKRTAKNTPTLPPQPAPSPPPAPPTTPPEGLAPGTNVEPAAAKPEPKPERPEDVSQWKPEDFLSAKMEKDQRLVEALQHLARRCKGDAALAKMLGELVAVQEKPQPKPEPKPDGTVPPGGPGNVPPATPPVAPPVGPPGSSQQPETVELSQQALQAAIWCLAINGTAEARAVLEGILSDKIDTGADRTAVDSTLKAIAAHPSPETDAILLRALTAPEEYRPPQEKPKPTPLVPGIGTTPTYTQPQEQKVPAAEIQRQALELAKASASEGLREKLALHLIDRSTPLDQVKLLGEFLRQPHQDNLRAQMILYKAPDALAEARKRLLGHFLAYSAQALARALGLPAGSQGVGTVGVPSTSVHRPAVPVMPGATPGYAGGAAAQPDPDLPLRPASFLWGPEFSRFLVGLLGGMESMEQSPQVVLLAGTVPTSEMRFRLHEALKAHWLEGPKALESAGFPKQQVFDPAMLTVVKLLPRAREPKTTTTTTTTTRTGRVTSAARQREEREQAEQEWLRVSADVVTALCERFEQAGLQEIEIARQERRRPDFTAALRDLPVELHAEIDPASSYRLAFPGEVQGKVPGATLAPMLVHYALLKDTEKMSKVVAHYRRQLSTRRVLESQQGVWIDTCREGGAPDRLRSIDVLISTGSGRQTTFTPKPSGTRTAPREKNEPEELTVQILSIEVLDPSRDPSAPAEKPEAGAEG